MNDVLTLPNGITMVMPAQTTQDLGGGVTISGPAVNSFFTDLTPVATADPALGANYDMGFTAPDWLNGAAAGIFDYAIRPAYNLFDPSAGLAGTNLTGTSTRPAYNPAASGAAGGGVPTGSGTTFLNQTKYKPYIIIGVAALAVVVFINRKRIFK